MALINIAYCASWDGRRYEIVYDDEAHVIISGESEASCSGPLLSPGTQIYQHVDGSVRYKVFTQVSDPFAYVVAEDISCLVNISSVATSNSTTNITSDGSATINATGNGVLSYSLDGVTWQSSNVFNNLSSINNYLNNHTLGNYVAYVKNTYLGQDCITTEPFTIAFDDVDCALSIWLGGMTVIPESEISANDGAIKINQYIDANLLPVEYRFGASESFQDSNQRTGLAAGVYAVTIRYKNWGPGWATSTCSSTINVTVPLGTIVCDSQILDVSIIHEQTRFGKNAVITIHATTTNGPLEYSLDGGDTWQEQNVFLNVQPGPYTLAVRDGVCEYIEYGAEINVLPFKAPYIEIPIVNGLRFVLQSGPAVSNEHRNFDNRLFASEEIPGVGNCDYLQKRTTGRIEVMQFRSSYSTNRLRIYNKSSDALVSTILAQKKKALMRYTDTGTVFLADAGAGKVQLFFSDGLPEWAVAGRDITISDTGEAALNNTFEIEQITNGTLDAAGYQVALITATWPGGGVKQGDYTTEYDLEPFDIFEVTINWANIGAGQYYMLLDGSDVQFNVNYLAESEPVQVLALQPKDLLLISYRNNDNAFQIDYDTGITHFFYFEGEFKWPLNGGERTVMDDSRRRLIKLREFVTRNPQLRAVNIPPYLSEKLALALAHDSIEVNGVAYQTEEDYESEYMENEAFCIGRAKLRQVIFNSENQHDAGDVDNAVLLEVNNTLLAVDL